MTFAKLTLWSGVVLAATAAGTTATCHAMHGHTVHAWKRTFHTCSALEQPLRPYFVPRRPGDCGREPYCRDAGWNYPPSAVIGCEPARFERLGHIPNPLSIDAAAAGR